MGRRLLAPSILSAAFLTAGCSSDLFHGTGWSTLCEREPKACAEPGADGGDEGDSGDGVDSSADVALDEASDAALSDAADGKGGG